MKKLVFILSLGLSLFAASTMQADTKVTPILDVSPEYPQAALRRDASGYVTVRFDIGENGKAHNLSIVEAQPELLFNNAVRRALLRSTFEVGNEGANNIERTYRFDRASESSRVVAN